MAHVAIAIWNGFFGPSFGAEGDAVRFHEEAVYYANNLANFEYVTGWVYSYFLGILYRVFTDHIFFGSIISVFSWLISAIILIKTMDVLEFSKNRMFFVVILFSLWPSALLNTSVTLRESFQTLGINCMIYSSILIFWKGKNTWPVLLFGILLASALHGALIVFSAVCLIFLLYQLSEFRYNFSWPVKMIFISFFATISIFVGFYFLGSVSYNFDAGLIGAVESYNEGASSINARADYRSAIDLSTLLNAIVFFPVSFFQFMMEPIPSRIGNIQDASLFVENMFRVGLLFRAIFVNRRIPLADRPPHTFMLLLYVALSFIWSIGTVNWGTASRHHAPGLMLVIVAGLAMVRRRPAYQFPRAKSGHVLFRT
jgi:hypothetical protein